MAGDESYPVRFTRESARRIARVVRSAEAAPPAASPLTFDRLVEGRAPKQVRAATFSGAWPIGSSKVVTFTNMPTNTANVQNLSWPITDSGYVNENCIVGKDGTAWYLVVPVLSTATAVFVTQTATAVFSTATATQSISSGISLAKSTLTYVAGVSATLNTADCSITVSHANGNIEVVTGATITTSSFSVVSQSTTGVMIRQTATATILTLRVP